MNNKLRALATLIIGLSVGFEVRTALGLTHSDLCTHRAWIGGAGASATSGSFKNLASIGQPFSGAAVSQTDRILNAGFIQLIPTVTENPDDPDGPTPVAAPDVNGPRVYPNPFRPGKGDTVMHIGNLPARINVSIFTLAGEHVRTIETDGTGEMLWDVRNTDGEPVKSGVYLGFVKKGSGRNTIKIAVER